MKSIENFLEEIAKATPTPGGGSVAAFTGALACSLAEMVCNLTIGKKKYAEVEEEMKNERQKMEEMRKKFLLLVEEDAKAFDEVMEAFKEKKNVQEAYKRAAEVPCETAMQCVLLINEIKEIAEKGNKNSITDAGVAALLAYASFHSALLNVKINLSGIDDKRYKDKMEEKMREMEEKMKKKKEEVMEIVNKWL